MLPVSPEYFLFFLLEIIDRSPCLIQFDSFFFASSIIVASLLRREDKEETECEGKSASNAIQTELNDDRVLSEQVNRC